MKKISEKFKTYQIAVVFAAAALFIFPLFFATAKNVPYAAVQIEHPRHHESPAPDDQHKMRCNIFRADIPVVNSSKNENSSSPPLNRINGVLFFRVFFDFSAVFRDIKTDASISFFQKYLKNSIPIRAGPSFC